jgi:hypothetical protein
MIESKFHLCCDPLAGWTADQAFPELIDAGKNDIVCTLRVDTQFITPTVKTLVGSLASKTGNCG